jgi:hypothetical protein
MPALVTAPPVFVDATNASCPFFVAIHPWGPFQVGANLYQVLTYNAPGMGSPAIAVYLSTDNGATWTEQDAAHHIIQSGNIVGRSVAFNAATGIILILIQTTSGPNFVFEIQTFSTATNLYTGTSAVSGAVHNATSPAVYQQSGGTTVIITNNGLAANQAVSSLALAGGVWTGPTALTALSSASTVYGVLVDSSDNGYVFYDDPAGDLHFLILSPALAVLASSVISTTWDNQVIDQRIWKGNVVVAFTEDTAGTGAASLKVAIAPLGTTAFTTYLVFTIVPPMSVSLLTFSPTLAVDRNGNLVVFVTLNNNGDGSLLQLLQFTFNGISSWGPQVLFYDAITNPPPSVDPNPIDDFIFSGSALQLSNGAWMYLTGMVAKIGFTSFVDASYVLFSPASVVIASSGGGGTRGGHRTLSLTDADFCLYRRFRLILQIDPYALSCARKPSCFLIDEREWYGEQWNEDEELGVGPPLDNAAIALNPRGSVVLPAPADGDVTILSFLVPYGYDGILLGQFHGYYAVPVLPGPPPPNFVQGSGDIQWRISANGRFVKDCGNMLVSIGSIRSQSPIAGGIQLRSGDLVKYLVNVPNTSGALAPGVGSIVAGLHGYFYPRH